MATVIGVVPFIGATAITIAALSTGATAITIARSTGVIVITIGTGALLGAIVAGGDSWLCCAGLTHIDSHREHAKLS